jgi:small subunit ribosomal protein S7
MPRRRASVKRILPIDPVYGSQLVTRLINEIMERGKKSIAENIVYKALDHIKEVKKIAEPLAVLERALDNIQPLVEVKSRRVGGATYQVPIEVIPARATSLAMRWLTEAARKRGEKTMYLKLAAEIFDAASEESDGKGKGGAVKKREDTHRMAEANKAFSHYRW